MVVVETLALQVDNNGGVYVVPAFAGLGAPYWNQHARGTITGLTRGTNAAHIARAAVESIAYQTMDVLKAMESDSHISIREIRVDGGATQNNLLMQFQGDVLGINVVRPIVTETTALGAAMLAGIGIGMWDMNRLREMAAIDHRFGPQLVQSERDQYLNRYKSAVRCVCGHAC